MCYTCIDVTMKNCLKQLALRGARLGGGVINVHIPVFHSLAILKMHLYIPSTLSLANKDGSVLIFCDVLMQFIVLHKFHLIFTFLFCHSAIASHMHGDTILLNRKDKNVCIVWGIKFSIDSFLKFCQIETRSPKSGNSPHVGERGGFFGEQPKTRTHLCAARKACKGWWSPLPILLIISLWGPALHNHGCWQPHSHGARYVRVWTWYFYMGSELMLVNSGWGLLHCSDGQGRYVVACMWVFVWIWILMVLCRYKWPLLPSEMQLRMFKCYIYLLFVFLILVM
jgi:hypothetical protein